MRTEAQINLDSLRQNIENSNLWTKTKTVDYFMRSFQRFERVDHLESFDLFIDSAAHLNEHIRLTAVYMQFDNLNRRTKRIGYNMKGNYFLWDYSPIEIIEHHDDTTLIASYSHQFILTEKIAKITDIKGRIIEELWYDKNLKLYHKVTYNYKDHQNELLITTFDGKNQIKYDEFGVGIKLQKFDSINRLVEERYYDSYMKLVEAEHYLSSLSSGFNCEFSILIREYKNSEELTKCYNSMNELQCESDGVSMWTTE